MRAALLTIFGQRNAAEGGAEAGVMLLKGLRDLFGELSATRLASALIVARLTTMEKHGGTESR